MNLLTESLNSWGEPFLRFALPMLWQSSLLIVMMFVLDTLLRRKIRAAVRYALWLVVIVKLILPPTLAAPTSIGWWLRGHKASFQPLPIRVVTVTHGGAAVAEVHPAIAIPSLPPAPPKLSSPAVTLLASAIGAFFLLSWMLLRWCQVVRHIRDAAPASERVAELLIEARRQAGLRRKVRLRITSQAMSPAVAGLFRPAVLLPRSLVEKLSGEQLRVILLHELIHLRRRDVWVNCAQTLLQIIYWWHPLLWFANARIRRLREEAVDDAVMLALNENSEIYAPTLVEVAKLALNRPLASLGLVGILESKNALRHRIERLLNFSTPGRAGLSVVSVLGIAAFTALAVPMGEPSATPVKTSTVSRIEPNSWPDSNVRGYTDIKLEPYFFIADRDKLRTTLPELASSTPVVVSAEALPGFLQKLNDAGSVSFNEAEPLRFQIFSGGRFDIHVTNGGGINREVNYQLEQNGDHNVVRGASVRWEATRGEWIPLEFIWTPWNQHGATRSVMELKLLTNPKSVQQAETTIPPGGGMVWAVEDGASPGKCQLVVLRPASTVSNDIANATAAQDAAPSTATPRANGLQIPNPYARTNVIYTNPQRQKLYGKLNTIAFDKISFSNLPLSEVIRNLAEQVKRTDSDQQEIHFLIKTNKSRPLSASAASQSTFDPGTGAPVTTPRIAKENIDLGSVKINLDPELRNIRLMDVLEAIVESSDHPIKYSMSDYGIEFSFKRAETPDLHNRTFHVDPNIFYMGLQNLGINPPGNATGRAGNGTTAIPHLNAAQIQSSVTNFFRTVGVNLVPPESLYFNDRLSTLTVHTTADNLDLIEAAIMTLDVAPPQVTIKVRFVELHENTSWLQKFDWISNLIETNYNGTSTNSPVILSDAQFKSILKALEARDDADLLNEGQVTTLTGRQAQFQILNSPDTVTNKSGQTKGSESLPESKSPALTLDVVPSVCADGSSIQMTLIPTVTEFFDYDNSGNFVPTITTNDSGVPLTGQLPLPHSDTRANGVNVVSTITTGGSGIPLTSPLPLPRSRVPQVTTSCTVWDGQTVVLRDFSVWGAGQPQKKNLLIFVTPTIIDPSGNRIHSKDYYDGPVY